MRIMRDFPKLFLFYFYYINYLKWKLKYLHIYVTSVKNVTMLYYILYFKS